MFGWIHESIRQLILRKYGAQSWSQIIKIANFEEGTENQINKYYKDSETMRLINAVASVIGIPAEEVWEAYGGFLIQFTMETGWDELLRAMAHDLRGFLDSLDALHYFIDHVVYRAQLKGPSFRCEPVCDNENNLILHYYSRRVGLYPIVKGVVREISRRVFDVDVTMTVNERKQETGKDGNVHEHVVFSIKQMSRNDCSITLTIDGDPIMSAPAAIQVNSMGRHHSPNTPPPSCPIRQLMSLSDVCHIFPDHIVFDNKLTLKQVGANILKVFPSIVIGTTNMTEIVLLTHPEIILTFEKIREFINGVFEMEIKESETEEGHKVSLKGQMIMLTDEIHMLYMCSINVTTVREMIERGIFLNDIPLHDASRDLILLNQSRMSQVELNNKLEEATVVLKKVAMQLESEKEKTNTLLRELLPASVAEQLRLGKTVDAGEFPEATLLFTDIVTFTNICGQCTPYDVVALLNDLYLRFDRLSDINQIYKVETIGDAYMAVAGVPEKCKNHGERMLNAAIGMIWESRQVMKPGSTLPIQIRVGVHCGPVVAGVVGKKMPRYCLFGDAVDIANKMESHSAPNKIHVSAEAHKAANTTGSFEYEERGWTKIKGKEDMFTYWLVKNTRKSVWDLVDKPKKDEHSIDGYKELHEILESNAIAILDEEGRGKAGKSDVMLQRATTMSRIVSKWQTKTQGDAPHSQICALM